MEKIDRLVQQMTLEEKISLLAGADLWHTNAVARLGIPALRVTDGPNGARGAFGNLDSTSACTPVGIALGATWNLALVKEIGKVLGEETKSKGAQVLLAPTVNIHRSPLAGRNFECFSEDPYLSGEMATAYIQGVQSQGVGACIKHFVCNDQESERFSISAEVAERPLHEIYLEPFRKAIAAARPWAVMSAYNRINGVYAAENDSMLRTILREAWGFDGVILSDWYGTYSADTPAGELDLEMPGPARWMHEDVVRAASDAGKISEDQIDAKVRRLLNLLAQAGLFDNPDLPPDRSVDLPAHRKVIRAAAQEAMVLLKNEELLPLDAGKLTKIAVIGENAMYSQVLGGGSSAVAPHYLVSPLDGIRTRVGQEVEVGYAPGCFIHKGLPAPDLNTLRTDAGEPGLTLEFFDNLTLSGSPAYALTSKRVQFGWFDKSIPAVNQEQFSVRLSGKFVPQVSGTHTLGLNAVGWGRLFINEEKLIDTWDLEDPHGQRTVQVEMEAGQAYAIRVEFKWSGDIKWRMLALGHLPPHAADLLEEAVALARQADVVVLVAGLNSEWESEGFDRPDLLLPGDQNALIHKVAEVNPNTVVVLNCGSPVEMPWLNAVPAVLQMWYDSQEQGNALADILFGDVSPSGKLPLTFPRKVEDNPCFTNFPGENGQVHYGEGIFVGYRYYDQNEVQPLFPFGYGLSYTRYAYRNLAVVTGNPGEEGVRVSLEVSNTGNRAGKEVVQVYVRAVNARKVRPEKELKAFQKVMLGPGESKRLVFDLGEEAFWVYDPDAHGWVVDPGMYEILVGSSSRDIRLREEVFISTGSK